MVSANLHSRAGKEFQIVEAALSLLKGRPEVSISTGEWAAEAGYSVRTLQRYLRTAAIADLLTLPNVSLQKQGQKWVLRTSGVSAKPVAA